MGASIRTRNFLNLDLPSMIWKQVIGIELNTEDLNNIDRFSIQCLDNIKNIDKNKDINRDNFNDYFEDHFVTYLSDSSEKEIIKDGRTKLVTFDNRVEYV